MISTVIYTGYNFIKNLLIYQPSLEPIPFVLDKPRTTINPNQISGDLASSLQNLKRFLRYAARITSFLAKANAILREDQHPDRITDLKAEYQALEKHLLNSNLFCWHIRVGEVR